MTATDTIPSISDREQFLRDRLGLQESLVTIPPDISNIFETGVLATVRITAERFAFAIRLSDLGLVPTRERQKDKIKSAIDAVLRASQRASLLPRDEMYYVDASGSRHVIVAPEATERQVRFMFPTRYDEDTVIRQPDTPSTSTWYAVPMNGMTFIPLTAWDKWNSDFERAKASHTQSAQVIVENYDRIKAASVRHYLQIALDVYNRLLQTAPGQLSRSVLISETNQARYSKTHDAVIGKSVEELISPLDWMRRWKRAVVRAWPSKEDILANYSVKAKFYWVPLPSSIAEDRLRTQQIEEAALQDRREAEMYTFSSEKIAERVQETQGSQVYDLTVSYVKTILERTELVFLNFLSFVQNTDRAVSPQQLNSIIKVVEMIKVLGDGVSGLNGIKKEALKIEKYINDNIGVLEQKDANKWDRKAKASEITMNLPAIIARAVNIMRVEAEGLIGLEARRTAFSAQDPMAMFNEARLAGSQSDFAGARNRAIAAYEEEDDALLPAPVPELDLSDSSEDQWTFSARIR